MKSDKLAKRIAKMTFDEFRKYAADFQFHFSHMEKQRVFHDYTDIPDICIEVSVSTCWAYTSPRRYESGRELLGRPKEEPWEDAGYGNVKVEHKGVEIKTYKYRL